VTEEIKLNLDDARRLFDLAVDTPLLCSGSFETDDVRVLRRFARAIGVDPKLGTPTEFERDFPHPFKPFDVRTEHNEIRDDSAPFGTRWETDEEVYARLGENPDRCSAGGYSRRCSRPADHPLHQPDAPEPAPEPDWCGTCGERVCDTDCPGGLR
jgi:hypothetical protein